MVTSHAINTVKVKNVLVSQGGKANIVVELANSESVTAFTMKLVLPQGVKYVSFSKNDSRFSDHELWDGSINSNKTFGCLSAQNSPIAGTNGTLLTITINADASLHEGTELTATMKDITLSTTSLSEITLEDVTFKIIVKAPGFIPGDVNGDGVPELTVTCDNMISTDTAMLIFDGNDYVPAKFNGHTWEGTPVEAYVYASMVMVCKEENILYIASKHGYENISIIKFEEDNSLTPIYESNYTAVYKNGKRVANGFSDFENSPGLPVIDQYNWTELTADTFYAEANETAVKGEQERQKIMEEAERIANSENYE